MSFFFLGREISQEGGIILKQGRLQVLFFFLFFLTFGFFFSEYLREPASASVHDTERWGLQFYARREQTRKRLKLMVFKLPFSRHDGHVRSGSPVGGIPDRAAVLVFLMRHIDFSYKRQKDRCAMIIHFHWKCRKHFTYNENCGIMLVITIHKFSQNHDQLETKLKRIQTNAPKRFTILISLTWKPFDKIRTWQNWTVVCPLETQVKSFSTKMRLIVLCWASTISRIINCTVCWVQLVVNRHRTRNYSGHRTDQSRVNCSRSKPMLVAKRFFVMLNEHWETKRDAVSKTESISYGLDCCGLDLRAGRPAWKEGKKETDQHRLANPLDDLLRLSKKNNNNNGTSRSLKSGILRTQKNSEFEILSRRFSLRPLHEFMTCWRSF
jgi:hypothetical protein